MERGKKEEEKIKETEDGPCYSAAIFHAYKRIAERGMVRLHSYRTYRS